MNRAQCEKFITENYECSSDLPWENYPENRVFRHTSNRKWFALFMTIPRDKIGLRGKKPIDVMNVKCDVIMIGSLLKEKGFFPAYHMNKQNWITVALDGSADDEKLKWALDMSFEATNVKMKKKTK